MKKIYKQILLALSVLLMVGCQNTNTKMKKVAIIQYMEHASLDTIKAAFDQQMENLGYKDGENVEYIFKMHKEITILQQVLPKHFSLKMQTLS